MPINTRFSRWLLAIVALGAAFALGVWSVDAIKSAQPSAVSFGTGFSYQGYLRDDNGDPLTDTCDLTFRLYDSLTLGNQVGSADVVTGVAVSGGLFTTVVNDANEFGAAGFNGGGRFLDISVKCSGDATTTNLAPRQPINPVPYARFAERFAGYENLIVVAKQGGDFSSVTEAVDAIGVDPVYAAASPTNRYLIYIAPGIYEDEHILMKEYVDIEGSGQGVTVLTSIGGSNGLKPESATLVGASNAELRQLTVENVSSGPGNWTFAIYTAANTSFSDVTAMASGGGRPRGMVVHGGAVAFLQDVSLIASGGSVSNNGLDVFQASALGDRIFANVSGGQEANGFYINQASSEVKLENVTSFAFDGSIQTSGMYVTQSQVNLAAFDASVSANSDLVSGIYCSSGDSRLNATGISLFGTNDGPSGDTLGLIASNCSLTLKNASIDFSAPGRVYGLTLSATDTVTRDVEINQLDIQANSSADVVYGFRTYTGASTQTFGRVTDLTIQASGQLTTSNSHGISHEAEGTIQYQDVAIDITGKANFMYGIKASKGTPAFHDVVLSAYGEAETTVFGAEFITPISGGSMDNAQILAENIGSNDAVGLKANSAGYVSFRNISSSAFAPANVWGYDLVGSYVTAVDLYALVLGQADGSTMFGLRCNGGQADVHNAALTVEAGAPGFTSSVTYGAYLYNCESIIADSQLRARGDSGAQYGLYAYSASAPGAPSTVRNSYLQGASGTVRTTGDAQLYVVNSQLDGGAGSTGSPTDLQECTAVTYNSGGSYTFQAATSDPCP